MQNSTTPTTDFISPLQQSVNVSLPFSIGLISISSLLISAFIGFVFESSYALLFFTIAFFCSIAGLITVRNYKKTKHEFTIEQKQKLNLGKIFSLLTLIASSLAVLAVISFFILIGTQGFGR